MRLAASWVLTLALALTACEPVKVTLESSGYATTCTAATDCTPVYFGQLCGPCGACPNAAISTSERARYDAELKRQSDTCPPRTGPQPACAACLQPVTVCDAGTCQLEPR